MTHKEMTKHLRSRLAHEGIKARVRLSLSCGFQWVQVETAKFGLFFSSDEARKIATIANVNGLTYAQGLPVDCSATYWAKRPQGTQYFTFVCP